MVKARLAGVVVLMSILLGARPSPATVLDPAFSETLLDTGQQLASATGMAFAPDGSNRLFLTIKTGAIRIVKDGALLPTPFATISPLYMASECGVIGIAFDPDFLSNQFVYIFATITSREQQIIRFRVDGDLGIDPTPVMTMLPTMGVNHDGGAVGFGFDGKLYWAIGDISTGIGVNDDLTSLDAKVGRANPDGTAPPDNPFVDGPGPNNDFIWARGFRNPFSFTFQPATGALWVADVGAIYERIFVVGRGDHAGWSKYENNQPPNYITPVIKYRTNDTDTRALLAPQLVGALRAGGKVTFTTTLEHGFRVGETITTAGVLDPSFDGELSVATVPGPLSFTALQAGPDAQSGGGAAATTRIGGAVIGPVFYESSSVPPPYRGNLFFGDYVSGRIERVTLDPATNAVVNIRHWATDVAGMVDAAVGPDGDLYYVGNHYGALYRARWKATSPGIVVTPSRLWLVEGQGGMVNVRLALDPGAPTTVNVQRPPGSDPAVGVLGAADLKFDSSNWSVPQNVILSGVRDLDADEENALVTLTAGGMSETVAVRVRDDNGIALVVSTITVALTQGGTQAVKVSLSRAPSLDVQVVVSRRSGDQDITVAPAVPLIFTRANWQVPQDVTIAAGTDADGADDQAAIEIAAQGIPVVTVDVTVSDDDPPQPDAGPDAAVDAPGPGDARDGGADSTADRAGGGGDGCGCRLGSPAEMRPGSPAGGAVFSPLALLAWLILRRARRRWGPPGQR